MSDVPIQIVDENNRPVGSASKQEAWRKGLIHQTVRISIMDEDGNLLVQKRSFEKELFPGRWDNSVAGHVDAGETYEQAALRELKEELGIEKLELTLLGDYYVEVIDNWRIMKRFTRTFRGILKKPLPKFTLDPQEVIDAQWMSVDKVKQMVKNHPEQVTDGLEQVITRFF